ncbi:hypothetical protein [Streptomyces humidus]
MDNTQASVDPGGISRRRFAAATASATAALTVAAPAEALSPRPARPAGPAADRGAGRAVARAGLVGVGEDRPRVARDE